MNKEDKEYCFRMGYDAEINGVTEDNCHPDIFLDPEKTAEWEMGKALAVKKKLDKPVNEVLKKTAGRPQTTIAVNRDKIRALRKGQGLRQVDMAVMTGYSLGRIAQFETGCRGGVPLSALKDISKVLGVDWRELLA